MGKLPQPILRTRSDRASSNVMTYDNLWGYSASSYWLKALSLPLLHWVKPFLPLVGLPDFLLKHPHVWKQIYTQAVLEYQIIEKTPDLIMGKRGEPVRQAVTKALQQLAAQAGRDVAIDFERWIIRHFFCHEVEIALDEWQQLLAIACKPLDTRRHQVPPPTVLVPILPEIAELVSFGRSRDI